MNVVECTGLTKSYFKRRVLDRLTAEIAENKIIGLIGKNGAGKTTLLKMIAGFSKQTSGGITVFSERPFNNLKVSINTIFVDDKMSFPNTLQLGEILEEAARFYPNWDMKLAKGMLAYFQFDPTSYHQHLSKGKISIFNMIVGICSRCPLTIFDEPTTGMDEAARKDFYRALLKDYIAYPRTIILSSHHIDEVDDLLEEVLVLHEGKKLLHLEMDELKEWSVGLRGPAEKVSAFIEGREVLHKSQLGSGTSYAVVQSSRISKEKAISEGIEVMPVKASDLVVYLTADSKGGIDDVFS